MMPALLTTRSTSSPDARSTTRDRSSGLPRSATSVSTPAAPSLSASFARTSSRSARRATSTSPQPRAASRVAYSHPMPEDAPVTRAVPGASCEVMSVIPPSPGGAVPDRRPTLPDRSPTRAG
ncbi:hypothetical protein ASR50_31045 [Streptomyces sp. 4F]|nr:hypothetical protein ASR50_31045 [Streptomyces sp. 4F]